MAANILAEKKSAGYIISRTLILVVLVLLAAVCLIPFYWMAIMGTLPNGVMYNSIPMLPGNQFSTNFNLIVSQVPFGQYYINTIIIAVCSTILTVFFSSLAGYTFAKIDFWGKEKLFIVVLATMLLTPQAALIGFVQEMKLFGWLDTFLPLIVPSIANAFGVFMIRQYAVTAIPTELLDSGRVDGCSEFRIFLQIVFPLLTPVVMALGILSFLGSWNNFLMPLVTLFSPDKMTLTIGIAGLKGLYMTNFPVTFLAMFLGMLPILVVYCFMSNFFISGLAEGAVKG